MGPGLLRVRGVKGRWRRVGVAAGVAGRARAASANKAGFNMVARGGGVTGAGPGSWGPSYWPLLGLDGEM